MVAKNADKTTALWVVKKLRQAGYEALFAGGSVRDMILGRRCHDYDVATNATPDQVKQLFRRVLMVGAKFGVAMVLRADRMVEVATFRSDLSYSDGRRPDGVKFSTPKQDALRRDFTINGMFYDPISEQIIDYVGGRADLAAGLVRTIGKAEDRFGEDYLRLMRAVRFSVQLNFKIDPATAKAVKKNAPNIDKISGERIFDELQKIFLSGVAAEGLELMVELGLARPVLPELFEQSQDCWAEALARVTRVAGQCDLTMGLGALLMDLPTSELSKIIRRWGQSNELKNALQWFSTHRDGWQGAADYPLCKFKRILANPNWERLKKLWRVREQLARGNVQQSRRIARRAGGLDPQQISPKPFVSGEDLLKMGLPEGRPIGRILKKLYDAQLDEKLLTRRQAMAEARKISSID